MAVFDATRKMVTSTTLALDSFHPSNSCVPAVSRAYALRNGLSQNSMNQETGLSGNSPYFQESGWGKSYPSIIKTGGRLNRFTVNRSMICLHAYVCLYIYTYIYKYMYVLGHYCILLSQFVVILLL